MSIRVTPLHPHIGAEVSGLDASRPLDDETLAEMWRAIDRWAVLVLHDQQLNDRQLHDFAARFGPWAVVTVASSVMFRRSLMAPARRRTPPPHAR